MLEALVSAVFPGRPNFSKKDLKYLESRSESCYSKPDWPHACAFAEIRNEEDSDCACSITSVSTNATMDDNPGPGRVVDKFIYQFLGRKIERLANRYISIYFLSPDRIVEYLWIREPEYIWPSVNTTMDLAMERICSSPHLHCTPRARIAGLKRLIQQSQ